MRAAESGFRPRDWLLACLLAITFKQAFGQMEPAQLQWLLRPLAWLLDAVSDLSFQRLANGEWLDARHGLVIVKACAGGNFMIASWLGYLWRWRHLRFNPRLIVAALAAAWLTTLIANALRILTIAAGQGPLSAATGLSGEESHRLIGILVYFLCLVAQMGVGRRRKNAVTVATVIYLGITLLLPALRASTLGLGALDAHHVLWTAGVPLALWLTWSLWRLATERHAIHTPPTSRAHTASPESSTEARRLGGQQSGASHPCASF